MVLSSILIIPSVSLPFWLEAGNSCYPPGGQHPNRRSLGVYDLIVVEEGCLFIGEEELTEAYIRQNFHRPLSNELLAEELHFHHNYLARCMKEIYGATPMEYVMRIRLEHAKLLLVKTDWAMTRIAEQAGFEYPSYFSRCFTAHNHISPLQYRKQYTV